MLVRNMHDIIWWPGCRNGILIALDYGWDDDPALIRWPQSAVVSESV